eukprot:PLAT6555.1.p1 GENE.PLAT6555.1~~PLAT6555.1.p1  ORF type:complete len:517 (-),score=182.55 PLAT6555.1:133-1638(-)
MGRGTRSRRLLRQLERAKAEAARAAEEARSRPRRHSGKLHAADLPLSAADERFEALPPAAAARKQRRRSQRAASVEEDVPPPPAVAAGERHSFHSFSSSSLHVLAGDDDDARQSVKQRSKSKKERRRLRAKEAAERTERRRLRRLRSQAGKHVDSPPSSRPACRSGADEVAISEAVHARAVEDAERAIAELKALDIAAEEDSDELDAACFVAELLAAEEAADGDGSASPVVCDDDIAMELLLPPSEVKAADAAGDGGADAPTLLHQLQALLSAGTGARDRKALDPFASLPASMLLSVLHAREKEWAAKEDRWRGSRGRWTVTRRRWEKRIEAEMLARQTVEARCVQLAAAMDEFEEKAAAKLQAEVARAQKEERGATALRLEKERMRTERRLATAAATRDKRIREMELTVAAAQAARTVAETRLAEELAKRVDSSGASAKQGYSDPCVICFDEPIDTCLMDCMHVCMCSGCAEKLRECPICRLPIEHPPRRLWKVGLSGGE